MLLCDVRTFLPPEISGNQQAVFLVECKDTEIVGKSDVRSQKSEVGSWKSGRIREWENWRVAEF